MPSDEGDLQIPSENRLSTTLEDVDRPQRGVNGEIRTAVRQTFNMDTFDRSVGLQEMKQMFAIRKITRC